MKKKKKSIFENIVFFNVNKVVGLLETLGNGNN